MADEARLRELFDRAIELGGAERAEFVERACAGDPEMGRELDALLEADSAAIAHGGWNRSALDHAKSAASGAEDDAIGECIGPYRIVELIGRGGMGRVYRAVRADALFEKSVALKRIQAGFDTKQIVQRFGAERQILARLEHPNIARLIDGGTDRDSLPYFVMEYVEGEQPLAYCNRRGAGIRERLEIFRQICAAVHYAHQQLVIHRDLKPGNILITADGTVKLLDFGVAKVFTQNESEHTLTALDARILTPKYASPEQISGEPVGTASDIYSLGVLLYELLAGQSPYGKTERPGRELMAAVCLEEPKAPSSVKRELRGDLDAIVLKALRKNPAERYVSADQFSEDIDRYLEGRPVRAQRGAFSYVAGKFLRRNWLATAAAAIAAASLVGGLVTATLARQRAERRFEQLRKLSHAVVFDYHDSIETLAGSTPVRRRMVKDALGYLDSLAAEAPDPSLERELIDSYVRVSQDQGNSYYLNLGDTADALLSARKAVALAQDLLKRDSSPKAREAAAAAWANEGDIEYGTGDLASAALHYGSSITLSESVVRYEPANATNLTALATALRHAGDLSGGPGIANLGKTEDALGLYRRAGEVADKLMQLQPAGWSARKARYSAALKVASVETITGRLADGERDMRQALEMIQSIATANPGNTHDEVEIASVSTRLGAQLIAGGRSDEALPLLERAIAILEKAQLNDPQTTLYGHFLALSQIESARALRGIRRLSQAAERDQSAIATAERLSRIAPGETEFRLDAARAHQDLAETLLASNGGAAMEEARRAAAILAEMKGMPEDVTLQGTWGRALRVLAMAQMRANALDAALGSLQLSVATLERIAQRDPANAASRSDLAWSLAAEGDCLAKMRRREAAEAYGRAISIWRELEDKEAITGVDAARANEVAAKSEGRESLPE
jgi:tetratricopeptide (TPR) repeat protein/tRNA A-37 threonylcarbamoyl transferase component Bud32